MQEDRQNRKPSIYNPIKDYEKLVLTAINIGTAAMNKTSESELKEVIMAFVYEYGMLGLMTALPTTPDFITYEAVYLPKNHFIREENISTERYLSCFFPFDKYVNTAARHLSPQDQTWNSAPHNVRTSTMYIRAGRKKIIYQHRRSNCMGNSSIIMYTTEDGLTKIETTFEEDTVWLSIDQMAELFQRDKSTISRHIKNIFEEGELQRISVVANFATTATDGKTYNVDYYNLDVIISVGYRVKSHRGTQFRIWAMGILKEYMKKGFALDDDRLKKLGGGNYFDELLARIRDIRSSEKVFWRKVLEIYATSIDYDPSAESSVLFFKQVQNKMHWAAHKHTAAEVIYQRADAEKDNMGLTSWASDTIRRSDVEVAKNYLTQQELDALNKIVTAYLDIAEVHALNQEPMYMKDWLETIDDYLKMTRRDILTSSGHISHKQALDKAHSEYTKYKNRLENTISPVEQDFIKSIGTLEEIADFGNK